ncbi:hypothetical protein GDO81_029423, partial [Engystomops pustulosus]
DYILKDPEERDRLFISSIPRSFPHRVIRAPVPWHSSYSEAHAWNEDHLFITNPMMLSLQELWISQFSDLRFVRTDEMLSGSLPLLPAEFEDLVERHCSDARSILRNKWIPLCASLFKTEKDKWIHLVPQHENDSAIQVQEFFACVSSLMSLQLRGMVTNSLQDLLTFFTIHK